MVRSRARFEVVLSDFVEAAVAAIEDGIDGALAGVDVVVAGISVDLVVAGVADPTRHRYAFAAYCWTMRCVLKNEALNAIVCHITAVQRSDLARSNMELERFAYVASHDLQEPMRTVRSFAQLLKRRTGGGLGGEADEYLQHITGGVERMQALINDLLAYSRVSSQGAAFARADCSHILKMVLDSLHTIIQSQHAKVTFDSLPVVRGDATQLAQLSRTSSPTPSSSTATGRPAFKYPSKSTRTSGSSPSATTASASPPNTSSGSSSSSSASAAWRMKCS